MVKLTLDEHGPWISDCLYGSFYKLWNEPMRQRRRFAKISGMCAGDKVTTTDVVEHSSTDV